MKRRWKLLLMEAIPFLIAVSLSYLINKELFILFLSILLVIYTFSHRYQKNEIILFILGAIIGTLIEFNSSIFLGQRWGEASLLSIPIWMPIFWGYVFVVIRRVGNIILNRVP